MPYINRDVTLQTWGQLMFVEDTEVIHGLPVGGVSCHYYCGSSPSIVATKPYN